ncbi:MAG: DNA starvation/stationary phase protection protein [Candidatus Cyclonatronum sp.]|uniref:Dps family protein n=1 Tax=Cyclonatronum sp. TaxID=3024185 RepID=UPI0025BED8AC|nr:Dps family protein [Cyclonatronum sp.]MCC5934359.1 DNA starvation/stationary phase protection protein [Balneolales bacterium]MCH8485834.1 DNA starvation/stationary phase protection protein [Cyclonatronum sp.]
MDIHIGITEENRKAIAEGLSALLSDSYMLYLKTHNYHWNVTGPHFHSLHQMFEEQYTELATAIDEIAERIRALGEFAPGTFMAYSKMAKVKEEEGVPEALEMVRNLLEANEQVISTARAALPACEEGDDEASLDLLTQRLQVHSKTAWMLRSIVS